MRRRAPDGEPGLWLMFVGVDEAEARFPSIRNDQPFAIRTDREEVRINAHGDGRHHPMISAFPDSEIIGCEIGDVAVAPVMIDRRQVRTLAGRNRRHDFVPARADYCHVARYRVSHVDKAALRVESYVPRSESDFDFANDGMIP